MVAASHMMLFKAIVQLAASCIRIPVTSMALRALVQCRYGPYDLTDLEWLVIEPLLPTNPENARA